MDSKENKIELQPFESTSEERTDYVQAREIIKSNKEENVSTTTAKAKWENGVARFELSVTDEPCLPENPKQVKMAADHLLEPTVKLDEITSDKSNEPCGEDDLFIPAFNLPSLTIKNWAINFQTSGSFNLSFGFPPYVPSEKTSLAVGIFGGRWFMKLAADQFCQGCVVFKVCPQ